MLPIFNAVLPRVGCRDPTHYDPQFIIQRFCQRQDMEMKTSKMWLRRSKVKEMIWKGKKTTKKPVEKLRGRASLV